MTEERMALLELVEKEADADLVREMLAFAAERIMEAEAEAAAGAAKGARTLLREAHRNGYRERDWDTRAGRIELAIPRLRKGSYFPVEGSAFNPRAPPDRREGAGGGGAGGLRPRRLDARRRRPGEGARRRRHVEEPGPAALRRHRHPRERLPQPPAGGQVALSLARRHLPQGARRRPGRQPCRDSRRRGRRGRQARGAGHRHGAVRGGGVLDRLPPLAGRPRPA